VKLAGPASKFPIGDAHDCAELSRVGALVSERDFLNPA